MRGVLLARIFVVQPIAQELWTTSFKCRFRPSKDLHERSPGHVAATASPNPVNPSVGAEHPSLCESLALADSPAISASIGSETSPMGIYKEVRAKWQDLLVQTQTQVRGNG